MRVRRSQPLTVCMSPETAHRVRDLLLGCGRAEDWVVFNAQINEQMAPFNKPVLALDATGHDPETHMLRGGRRVVPISTRRRYKR
ncbi:MAG: hypothetical protein RLZZ524_465 [Pseudomonadota bacterium]|jgi:hypothetical protein